MLAILACCAGIMLNTFATLLCSKLCWHNRLKPSYHYEEDGDLSQYLGRGSENSVV